MADNTKDVLYIDVEDEITTVIDKVTTSNKKLVALVLPKRASVFQSIVNMKLLKRKSDEAKKNLVLVTAEAGLLPLAGSVGIHVARTLASKPEIPAAPIIDKAMVEANEDESIASLDEEPLSAASGTDEATGEGTVDLKKAGQDEINKAANNKPKSSPKDLDTIELDNTDADKPTDTAMPAIATAEAKKKAKAKKDKSLKVPNFERFRLIAIIGGLIILILVVGFILLFKVFPHATINIKTNAQNVDASLAFNLDTSANNLNKSTNTVPAKEVSETKTYTATVNATGQQNNGQTATGSVTFSYQDCGTVGTPPTIPAGTGIAQNNLTYITQSSASVSTYNGQKNNCFDFTSSPVNITAQQAGSSYNTSSNNTNFTVPSYSAVTAIGGASGGSDDIVTVVSQTDINNAENKISTNSSGAKSDLSSELTSANYYPLNATFTAGTPNISPNATAGTATSSVTVTETIKYVMYGVIKSDLNSLLNSNITSQAGSNQNILSNGLSNASYSIGSSPTNISLVATAVVGPNINVNTLKEEITGQKTGSIESIVKSDPDVSSVSVKLSPFYVSKAPTPSKITINIAKPTNSPSNASNN